MTTPLALALTVAVGVAACSPAEAHQDVDPDTPPTTAANLDDLPRDVLFVDGIELHLDGDTGRLSVTGDLPTPCHMVASAVENGHERIEVEIWTVHEPDVVCTLELLAFEVDISLGEVEGTEPVFLNGEEIGWLSA